jgi:uncharacterized protein YbjT (DUF2867 family)
MYVVIGASGNTGHVAAKTLLSRGHKVRAVARTAARLQALTSQGAEAFPCDITNTDQLTQAFKGAEAAYVMIPTNITSNDVLLSQERVGNSIATAISKAGVPFVVSLSSIGADKPTGTGPVVGLHNLEQKLNSIDSVNVLHLRAGYFMENTLGQAGAIRSMGTTAGPVRPDLKLPMIATRDIGAVAAEALLQLDFKGKQTRELLGQRDLDYREVAVIIGKAIGKPDLGYVQAPDEQFLAAVVQMGMSQNMANLILEMSKALNSGYMKALESRNNKNTTPTSFETFVAEVFMPVYKQQAAA